MAALSIPPELKKISAYIRRAEELDKDTVAPESRLVAYYCRQYAVHQGIPLASTSAAAKECLGALLGLLEMEKPAMDSFTRDEAKFLCKSFADKVFNKADEEDRLGVANKGTAKTFYAAATFIQILDQFCDPERDVADLEDIKKRVLYSKWKSTEILKALKEGRAPVPGGYGEAEKEEQSKEEEQQHNKEEPEAPDDELTQTQQLFVPPKVETVVDDDDDDDNNTMGIPPAPHKPPVGPMEPPAGGDHGIPDEEGTEVEFLPPPPAYPNNTQNSPSPRVAQPFVCPPPPLPSPPPTPPPPPPTSSTTTPSQPPPPPYQPPASAAKKTGGIFGFGSKKKTAGKVTKAQMGDAMELTKFALAALEDKDVDLASERLKQALQALGQ